jgi:hypothetical protein
VTHFSVRAGQPEDVPAVAGLLASAFPGGAPGVGSLDAAAVARLLQTGHRLLVAEAAGLGLAGVVRTWREEGVAWFDLLASALAGAGRTLVRAVEREAQDAGARLARARVPDDGRLPSLYAAWGYLPASRLPAGDRGWPLASLIVERRLPLLTVREPRREDGAAIAALTGDDPWSFRDPRPGWFVAADGERVVGVVCTRDAGRGLALVQEPLLAEGYGGRSLELWMIERAATWAATRGFHTAHLRHSARLEPLRRDLEDRSWFVEGAGDDRVYTRRLDREVTLEGMGDPSFA